MGGFDLERDLNAEQRSAVLHGEGPMLILAGAGSGKTRVVTCRIAHLIAERGVAPWQILAVTFTNKAAGEMRTRIERMVGEARGLWVSTFHAFGARLLRRHAELLGRRRDFVIYDEQDSKRLGREVLRELDLDPEQHRVERLLAEVERAKHSLKAPGEGGLRPGPAKAFYARYQQRLRQAEAFDFADLIFQVNRLFARHPDVEARYRERFAYVLVDEFQDTDQAQYRLLRRLCPPQANLCAVGDDDQSIYAWRGAQVGHILGFERDYPGCRIVKLERNYRSTARILEAASSVIARNAHRHAKRLWTEADPGPPVHCLVCEDEREEADLIARRAAGARSLGESLREMAVFYRVNAQSRALEEALRRWAIPYVIVGGTRFFDRAEVRDLLAYLRLLHNPHSDVDLLRVLNVPSRGIGARSRERIAAAADEAGSAVWDVLTADRLAELRRTERERVLAFRALVEALRAELPHCSAAGMIELVLDRTGYAESLAGRGEQERDRLENVRELVSAAEDVARQRDDASLAVFLEHVALASAVDTDRGEREAVTLMTLHAAKGLEFDRVFMVGLEDGLLPHGRALGLGTRWDGEEPVLSAASAMEEERRLCYVGMTRARKHLLLSRAEHRHIFGRSECHEPSRFLADLPGAADPDRPAGEVVDLAGFDLDEADEVFDLDLEGESVVDFGLEYSQLPEDGARREDAAAWTGCQVAHSAFGPGRVRMASRAREGIKLVVDFESVGVKTVMADYVRLLS
ncbi:MAG: UvrD-helicase domain-containing protein [Deltaproteobacteria bacterium]|nr:UvrD-helicase domain-containing protein [Deltaproteobacteria bacterium]